MKKKLLLLTIFIFTILSNTISQECLPIGIKFETQKQIDDFPQNHPGCIEIIGDVLIESNNSNAISNLDSLSQITSIGGYLKIWKNESLNNLHGLNNLSYLGKDLEIVLNKKLPNLKGLNNLTTINEYLKVNYNPALSSLNGLDSIKIIHDNLSIRSNYALTSLHGLESLDTVNGNLSIIKNESLLNLEGLNNLIFIGESISIRDNNSLNSLSGLNNLQTVNGIFDIYDNSSLSDFSTLENIIPDKQMAMIIDSQLKEEIRSKENVAKAKAIKKERLKSKYKFWISSMDNSSNFNGYLIEAKDSSMIISNQIIKDKSYIWNQNINANIWNQNIKANSIKKIEYRKDGDIGNGILFGALTGFAIGGLLGLASGDDHCVANPSFLDIYCFTAEEKALASGILLAIPGSLIGGLVGATKVKIPINGNQNTYTRQREKLDNLKVDW